MRPASPCAEHRQRRVPAELLGRQIDGVLEGWHMPPEQRAVTVRLLVEADLRGIDSHGVYMLPLYDEFRRDGRLVLAPEVKLVRRSAVTALIDGGGGLGHYPGHLAMQLAIEQCTGAGLGAVAVRNSNHYGAAGVYALMAAAKGFIGISTSAVFRPGVVPTFAAEPLLGTNPIAFAAPARRNPPFCLDMATSTVAIGKLKLAALNGQSIPEGWATDEDGRPVTDPEVGLRYRYLTPLGGTPPMSSHKGYGLGAMVEILSTLVAGAWYAPTRAVRHPGAAHYNVGQFFLALDANAFRDDGAFTDDMDDLLDRLHGAKRAEPSQPVLVAGELEQAAHVDRSQNGIPISPALAAVIREIAAACGAPFLLEDAL